MNGKPWSIATLVGTHQKIALDSNVLIYVLEGHDQFGRQAGAVLDSIEADVVAGSMATFGELEILVGPARVGDVAQFERSADEIRSFGLKLVPLTSDIAADAAWLQAGGGIRLGDAILVASARTVGATVIVTNDQRIRPRPGLDIAYLADLELIEDRT